MFILVDRWSLILKKWWEEKFFLWNQSINSFIPRRRIIYDAQSWKERTLLCESTFIPIDRWALILNMLERDFFLIKTKYQFIYHNKENMFIVPNHEKKRNYYVNRVYPNWKMNFDSKKWWETKFLLWNQSINSFIPIRRICLWCPIIKRKEIIMWIRLYLNWQTNFNSKNKKKRCFSYEIKVPIHLSQ